ncbi:amidohydrolase family protein [Streptomyces thinghirensis]|nr:amidohydrolase family protein [Streptomyces thinghirensis]
MHTTSTGLALTGLDLSGAPTRGAALALIRDFAAARPDDRVLLGHGWDASRWPDGLPPTRARAGRGHRRAAPLPQPYRRPLGRRHHRPARPRPR